MKSVWITFVLLAAISIGATFGITRHFYQKQTEANAVMTNIAMTFLGQHINKVCRLPNT